MRFDRPGCFGFAATYNVKSKVCIQCDFASECAEQARQALALIAERTDVASVVKLMHQVKAEARKEKSAAPELSQAALNALSRMPKHAAKIAESMIRSGINFRRALIEGRNPIKDGKPASIAVLFDLLLQGEVERSHYIEALKSALGHTQSTASSQASIGFAVISGLGIARQSQSGAVALRRDK